MGAGIAHVAAQQGFEVIVVDNVKEALEKGRNNIQYLVNKEISKGKLSQEAADSMLSRVSFTSQITELSRVDFVIEAVVEDLEVKQEVFGQLDKICSPQVILATNTSSLSITSIASVTERPDKVVGMHFFNPPQVMRLVEIVRGFNTSDETVKVAKELAEKFGKTTVEVKKDTPGFIVNRIMIPQFIEAIRLVEEGVATKEDVDTAVKLGLNYPMGPFELQDFAGVEIGLYVMDVFTMKQRILGMPLLTRCARS
ncbi:3-hydroxybutyryl-CoA dehydrogenase [Alicyclobacillus acidocaldarius subsp. acidocaldarius Tc-4-1]|uniref:3-hydroxybutyryl-CoA dehydrogenase n=1 Tax=Alicyclobacillus acidocaldarius (strain Tc-4-1) TaxID=1048834 RepID=F8ICT7_ALIAT|nr:3-hydroxybutyryl-CoA dehydrogenase [Alicyclobacillus acidocaldarius subsp. acidocaldarius Tc-4-1]